VPGTPRSSTLPRSSKPVPDPTTRSRTVRETRISPAPAWLPFLTLIGSLVISLFVPSGGGHWAVQGPIAVDSALAIGQRSPAYLGLISMAVAVGEGVANMIQPFWLLPLLAIAKLNVRQVMGFTIVAFVIGLVVLGTTALIAPYVI
jgi:short-chain fatty acids transporter